MMLALAVLVFVGCKGKDKKNDATSHLTEYEQGLTADDSIQLVAVVDNFFALVENNQVDLAVSTLFRVNPENPYAEPIPLTNEEMQEIKKVFEVFPIFGHRIDYIKFYESYLNEVKVSAIFREAKDGMPEGTTTYYFRAINYVGQWVLCAMNTWTGDDEPLVRDEDKDSLTDKFQRDKQHLDSVVYEATKDLVGTANGPKPEDAESPKQ
jgi:hypothetical protein